MASRRAASSIAARTARTRRARRRSEIACEPALTGSSETARFMVRLAAPPGDVTPADRESPSMVPQRVVVTGLGVASCLGGAVVQGYDREHFDRKEVRRLSRSSQLAVVAASQAVRQAGLSENGVERRDVAVLIGSSIGGYSASDNFFRDYYLHGWRGPLVIPTSMDTAPSSNVSIRFGLGGLLINVDGACAAAAHSSTDI